MKLSLKENILMLFAYAIKSFVFDMKNIIERFVLSLATVRLLYRSNI